MMMHRTKPPLSPASTRATAAITAADASSAVVDVVDSASSSSPVMSPPMRWLRLHVLYIVSFLDLLAVSMIIPSLASYIKGMDGGAVAFGYIMSMYGFIQFFSAPIAGGLSDVYGRRRVLLACFVGASVGYVILGLSWNIYLVILSRIPPALFKHSLDIIKVAVTDDLDPPARSAAIGRLNAASNAGFIIGPVVGGYVGSLPNGFNYTTMLTVGVLAINYALIYFCYEDHTPVLASTSTTTTPSKPPPRIHYKRILIDAKNKLLEFKNIMNESGPAQTLLVARLLLAMAAILYRTHFSTLLEDKFGTDPKSRGFVLSYMGLLGACGSISVGLATRLVRSERLLLQVSSLVYVATFLALSRATTISDVYVLLVPQVVSISMLRASSIGLQTTLVAPERVGAFMGISSSFTSVARTISPILSGWTYLVSLDGPAYGAAALASISAALFCFSPHFTNLGRVASSTTTAPPTSVASKSKKTATD